MVIVDDDRLQGQLLTEMLQRIKGISFNTTTTIHASEAIAIATESAPNIVFTDIEMPEMNGSEIMRRIRNNAEVQQRSCTTKFVAMTAHEQSIMPQLRSDGFDACLFKPFSVQTLAATICQLTGVAVRVSENSKLKTAGETENNSKLRTALLPFTDGDPEAERQIIGDIRKSIEEYLEMIGDGSDPERIAKAVHKAMPLLEMLEPGKNEWLAPLQWVHQQSKQQVHQQSAPPNDQERERLTKQLIEKLKKILCNIY